MTEKLNRRDSGANSNVFLFQLVCFIKFDKLYTYVHFMCMLYFKKHWKKKTPAKSLALVKDFAASHLNN